MTKIYHITHIRNLESIIASGGILCDNGMASQKVNHVGIAHSHIKERRARKIVACKPGGTLADYVPFYFAPRSPMLFSIHNNYVEGYKEGQTAVLHLVSSVDNIVNEGLKFVFTDGHAVMALSQPYNNLADLNKIDWQVMEATYWNDTEDDNDRSRRRQAEFLVHKIFPWKCIEEIGVINEAMKDKVSAILASCQYKPNVIVQKKWYY